MSARVGRGRGAKTDLLVFWVLGTDDVYPPLALDDAAAVAHELDRGANLHSTREDGVCRLCDRGHMV